MDKLRKKFSKIYDKNIDKIYRFVFLKVNSQERAEDITSQVFLRGWEVFQNEERKIKNPSAFLYKIARNLVIDFYRERDKAQIISTENLQMADSGQGLEEKAILNSDIEMVENGLKNIKDEYQEIIVWYYLEGLSTKEIAEILDKSPGAVRVTVHRALKALKKEIEEA